jgi:3-methyladenine DNA glycosylase AlkD
MLIQSISANLGSVTLQEVLAELRRHANPVNVEGMARFGITADGTLGIAAPQLRAIAKRCGRDHALAVALWDSGVHEAKHIAVMIEDPRTVTKRQLESWVRDINSWDVCDSFAYGLVDRTPFAHDLIVKWSASEHEFVKRAAFAAIAGIAVHDKQAPDADLLRYLPLIRREAGDDRNFVKKAVNWALRQVGKRNLALNAAAIETAEAIRAGGTRSGRWIAADALRELRGEAVQRRLRAPARPTRR